MNRLPLRLLIAAGLALLITAEASPRRPLVLLLGDSIRMNYQPAVTEALNAHADVWAPKENGRDTTFTLANLDGWLKDRKPAVIHINVGLHDLFLDGKSGRPRHTLAVYEKNLRAILRRLSQQDGARILFALTTPVNESRQAASKTYGRVVRRNTDIDIYNARARMVAEELGIRVNDLPAFIRRTGPERILRPSDGIHLSPEGCRLVGREVARKILSALETKPDGSAPAPPSR
jgi:lysophospholipase L1-like esterase